MHAEGPYLWLPTGVWHAKICSCSRIDINLRNKGTMLPFIGLFTWQRTCSQRVLTVFLKWIMETYHCGPHVLLNESTVKVSPVCLRESCSSFPAHPSLIILFFFVPALWSLSSSLLCSCWVEACSVSDLLKVFTLLTYWLDEAGWGWMSGFSGNNDPAWSGWLADTNHLLSQHLVASWFWENFWISMNH